VASFLFARCRHGSSKVANRGDCHVRSITHQCDVSFFVLLASQNGFFRTFGEGRERDGKQVEAVPVELAGSATTIE